MTDHEVVDLLEKYATVKPLETVETRASVQGLANGLYYASLQLVAMAASIAETNEILNILGITQPASFAFGAEELFMEGAKILARKAAEAYKIAYEVSDEEFDGRAETLLSGKK